MFAAAMSDEPMSPEETQGGEDACHLAAIGLQPLPTLSPQESQDVVTTWDTSSGELRCKPKE